MPAEVVPPISAAIVATGGIGGFIPPGTTALTPGATQPNVLITVITPLTAIMVRFVNAFLTTLVGLVTAGATTNIIPASDFYHLVLKCAGLSVAGAGIDAMKNILTIFTKLEAKYPLSTGNV
jgi:hypothetical protein